MEIDIGAEGPGRYVLRCPARMDWPARWALAETVNQAARGEPLRSVILDFERVERLDSAGIGAVLLLHRHVDRGGGRLLIARPCRTVHRLLRTVRMSDLVPITSSLEEARCQAGYFPHPATRAPSPPPDPSSTSSGSPPATPTPGSSGRR